MCVCVRLCVFVFECLCLSVCVFLYVCVCVWVFACFVCACVCVFVCVLCVLVRIRCEFRHLTYPLPSSRKFLVVMCPWDFLKGNNLQDKKGISILWEGGPGTKQISPIPGPGARGANEFCSVWLDDEFALTVLTAKYEKMSKNPRILLNCPKERKKLMSFPCYKMYFSTELKSFPGSQMPSTGFTHIYFLDAENILLYVKEVVTHFI